MSPTSPLSPFATSRTLLQVLQKGGPPISPGAREVLETLQDAGHEAFLAGGCVRDLLLGRTPTDYDVATNARPAEVMKLFRRVVPTGLQHGTVTVVWREPDVAGVHRDALSSEHIEVTTYRGEGAYLDGRRPETVEFLDAIEQDLGRRDFTINAIAFDPLTGDVRDPFGGVGDLARRRLRAVGRALERFSEDGLRPLRAVRFASMLGFGIERETREAIPATLDTFRRVAPERVRDELNRLLLRSPAPSRGLRLLAETGLLAEMIPELLEGRGFLQNRWHRWDVWEHTLRTVDHAPADLVVRLAALLHDVAKPRCAEQVGPGEHTFHKHETVGAALAGRIVERLRYPRKVCEQVSHLIREHNWYYRSEWTDGTVRRHLARLGPENLVPFLALREADLRARGRAVRSGLANLAELRRRFEAEIERDSALSLRDLAISGGDVMQVLGTGAGPRVGEILRALLQHVLDHPEDNDRERLMSLARTLSDPDSQA